MTRTHAHTHTQEGWTHVPYVERLTQELEHDPRVTQVVVSDRSLSLFLKGHTTPTIVSTQSELESLLSGYWGDLTLN